MKLQIILLSVLLIALGCDSSKPEAKIVKERYKYIEGGKRFDTHTGITSIRKEVCYEPDVMELSRLYSTMPPKVKEKLDGWRWANHTKLELYIKNVNEGDLPFPAYYWKEAIDLNNKIKDSCKPQWVEIVN